MSVDEEYRITHFTEKPDEPERIPGKPDLALASMGIYIFSMEFLYQGPDRRRRETRTRHTTSARTSFRRRSSTRKSMAYPYLNNEGEPAYWRDVGSV